MALREVIIRPATSADVSALVAVEREAWPAAMAADESQIRARIAAFPAGQLVAELVADQVVGVAWAQRIDTARLEAIPARFDKLTDSGRFTGSQVAEGEIYQLIGVAVAAAGRHARLGRLLVDSEIAQARSLRGVQRIVGFTRPLGYCKHPQLTIDEYAALTDAAGKPVDPLLAFHLTAGARLVSLHADFRPEDEQARGYGALIEYPLQDGSSSRLTI